LRDLDALLASLVNIDRDTLIALLSSEADAAERLAIAGRQRTPTQRAKRREVIERAARINRILSFLRDGKAVPDMPEAELNICKSLEDRLRLRNQT